MSLLVAKPVTNQDDIETQFRRGSATLQRHFQKVAADMSATYKEAFPSTLSRTELTFRRGSIGRRCSFKRVEEEIERELCLATTECWQEEVGRAFPSASLVEQRFRRGSGTLQQHFLKMRQPELIFSGEYTKAMEETFHKDHLACFKCEKQLIACRYIAKEEHPYCVPCYQELFAHNCEVCGKPIGPDYKDLSYKDRHWHEGCFKCSQCQNTLVNQPFAPKDEQIFCSECYDNNFAARCDACTNPFRGGMKKFEYKGNKWHEECFTCGECQQPIGNKSFIPRDERVICLNCYESNYAQKCTKCSEVINKGGISYKNTPFHRECFTCTNCNKMLAGEKFTSKDEQPYCGDCFGELFAKRCCRCTKPITGIGGTKFISFEDRHWHSDCFICYRCDAAMVGRGFLMQGEDILCPDCGRS
ncbi:hypothetical protein ACOMHN_001836 [Nucella lapillus]